MPQVWEYVRAVADEEKRLLLQQGFEPFAATAINGVEVLHMRRSMHLSPELDTMAITVEPKAAIPDADS